MTYFYRLSLFLFFCVNGLAATPPTGRYKQIVDGLLRIQSEHPMISEVFSIGTNDEDTEIFGIRISLTPKQVDPKKIGHIMVSTHHGDELKAPVFTMRFIADLISRFESDEVWRGNLADTEWHIIPVLNISGYNAGRRHEHGMDPNRDYEGPCTLKGGKLKSIRQLTAYLKTRIFSGNVTVHGYDGSLTYPWGVFTDKDETLDHNFYHQIFGKAAQLNNYRVGTAGDVVYPADGCYEDYVYWKHGHWSMLVELRDGSDSDITRTIRAVAVFYDQLSASPSTKNQFEGNCTGKGQRSLRWE